MRSERRRLHRVAAHIACAPPAVVVVAATSASNGAGSPCLLVANRGEVAIRICRAAAQLGVRTVAVYSQDDAACLHTRRADVAVALEGHVGAAAYLDQRQLLDIAARQGWVCRP
eukprot:COSAG01_NODE_1968_length_8769_cov_5.768166_16_plen_114_part_00